MAHPGTYTNAPTLSVTGLVPGDSNTAVNFAPASNQYVVQNDTITARTLTAWTIGGIVKPDAFANAVNFWGIDAATFELDLRHQLSGRIGVAFAPGSGFTGFASFDGSTVMSAGSTYRVIATWDGSTVKLYVNGALDGGVLSGGGAVPVSGNGGSLPFGSAQIIAGGGTGAWVIDAAAKFHAATDVFDTANNTSLDGTLDELFFIANYAATSGDIATIDAAMTGSGNVMAAINALAPYIYWRLGEASGTTAQDSAPGGSLYTPPIANECGPILYDSQGLSRALFRHYAPRPRFQTVWKLNTSPITYSLTQPFPLITPEDVRMGNTPIGQTYNAATYLHVYYGPETVDQAEADRLIASGIGTVT